ncbi:MAG: xanthine dehydrogenase family protein subunit M [Deltaproteobacteria bacterium]|nr:xanthine dehydrogenase family protein subunit M [Deltaproteobacteria bacterium]MBW2018208.1 xanthine dehydrogenase family protein subunit M [Deltaproteobacteria bacterium]MBW2130777.1 xanthine dehydrogenase family protein subunit M [Deltaproteobacteria bacterium]
MDKIERFSKVSFGKDQKEDSMAKPVSIQEYLRPKNLLEACECLGNHPEARLLAGGTDLLNALSRVPEGRVTIISLRDIGEIREVRIMPGGEVFIGATASHREVTESPIIREHFPSLAKACGMVGSPSIRNTGTIGGNVATASPSADSIPPLIAYEAGAVVFSPAGEREVPVEELFLGPSKTILRRGEILKGFRLRSRFGRRAEYEKLGTRKAMEIAVVNACVSLVLDDGNTCDDVRIALGAVAPTPVRAKRAEEVLRGKILTEEVIRRAAGEAMEEIRPISDIRASAGYRKSMTGVLVQELITRALPRGGMIPRNERRQ